MIALRRLRFLAPTLLLGAGLVACGGGAEAPPADQDPVAATAVRTDTGQTPDMHGMHADPAAMQRHAQEADSAVAAMRAHLQQMRQLTPAQQHARIGEHVAQVSRMLGLMDRHMREMDMGMGMDDAHMGEMMGMTAAEHRSMMEEMRTLRTEAEQLQVATAAQLREQMPPHLDRIEQLLRMMEQSAAHMRAH
jgi:hypothetical protein